VAFRGVAATGADRWDGPLGPVAIDTALVARVVGAGLAVVADAPHAPEHALEVQLPFLQTVVPDALLAPFVVGDAPAGAVAALVDAVWDDPGTVVVISTDLSHYHRYDDAVRLDRHTAAEILACRPDGIGDRDACGNRPLRGLLQVAHDRQLRAELLDLRNSGDTAGDRNRVVGYGAFAFS
jgi:AmmeMemoRadiSam system protein B